MKKVIAVFLAVLMFAGAFQVAAVPAFAADQETPSQEEIAEMGSLISKYKDFSYECNYCHETHEGFMGIFIAMLHTMLSVFDLAKKAIER